MQHFRHFVALRKGDKMTAVEPIRSKNLIKSIEETLKATNFRDYVLFCFGINSGLRISDILKLDVKDVRNKKILRLKEIKTGKYKTLPFNKKIRHILQIYTQNRNLNEPLFVTKFNNRMDRITAYRLLNRVCDLMKLDIKIGTHTLRKTFGYHFYKQYKDIVILQKIFNHTNPSVTLRYIGIEQDEVYKSYENFIL